MASRLGVFVSSALGLWLYSTSSDAAVTHTTANLNLRSGPSTSHKVKAVIPAGAAIDIHSCGHTWCYMGWAGHEGYVHSDYLVHHVTVVVAPLSMKCMSTNITCITTSRPSTAIRRGVKGFRRQLRGFLLTLSALRNEHPARND